TLAKKFVRDRFRLRSARDFNVVVRFRVGDGPAQFAVEIKRKTTQPGKQDDRGDEQDPPGSTYYFHSLSKVFHVLFSTCYKPLRGGFAAKGSENTAMPADVRKASGLPELAFENSGLRPVYRAQPECS